MGWLRAKIRCGSASTWPSTWRCISRTAFVFSGLLVWLGGYLTGVTATGLLAAIFANWLALRIYENRHLVEIGLWLNRRSAENLLLGLAEGRAPAALVLAPALVVGAAHLTPTPADQPTVGTIIFVSILLAAGSIGRGTVLPRVRISGAAGGDRTVGDGYSGGHHLRPAARRQPGGDLVQHGQYGGFRHPFWVRLPAQPRLVAADRACISAGTSPCPCSG